MYSMGGLLGEIILCFTTMQDYINSIPTFMNTPCFNSEQFELFLQHFMNQDVGRFNLILTKDLFGMNLNEDSEPSGNSRPDSARYQDQNLDNLVNIVKKNLAQVGLKNMLATA